MRSGQSAPAFKRRDKGVEIVPGHEDITIEIRASLTGLKCGYAKTQTSIEGVQDLLQTPNRA